jgi:hypothetical protein
LKNKSSKLEFPFDFPFYVPNITDFSSDPYIKSCPCKLHVIFDFYDSVYSESNKYYDILCDCMKDYKSKSNFNDQESLNRMNVNIDNDYYANNNNFTNYYNLNKNNDNNNRNINSNNSSNLNNLNIFPSNNSNNNDNNMENRFNNYDVCDITNANINQSFLSSVNEEKKKFKKDKSNSTSTTVSYLNNDKDPLESIHINISSHSSSNLVALSPIQVQDPISSIPFHSYEKKLHVSHSLSHLEKKKEFNYKEAENKPDVIFNYSDKPIEKKAISFTISYK